MSGNAAQLPFTDRLCTSGVGRTLPLMASTATRIQGILNGRLLPDPGPT